MQWLDYFCSYIESDMSWRIPLFMQSVIGAILAGGSLLMPESPRSVLWSRTSFASIMIFFRWLVDQGQDTVGLQVIVDLHGGDPDDAAANAEFQEIKDFVSEVVSVTSLATTQCSLALP
jgi:hypothetical protein